MSMFAKRKEPIVAENAPIKSKLQAALDHLAASQHHLSEAQNLFSMINFDLQKPSDYIARYREMIVNVIEAAGGTVEQGSVEEELKEFLPKVLQRAPEVPNG